MRRLAFCFVLLAAVSAHAQYYTSDGVRDPDSAPGDVEYYDRTTRTTTNLDYEADDRRYRALREADQQAQEHLEQQERDWQHPGGDWFGFDKKDN